MLMLPKISVITVVFNGVNEINNTIFSVISQNYCNLEYIIIDGKSNDGTLDVISKYKDKIALIISEDDSGIYDAMNKGVSYATGDWVLFMNSGDSFTSDSVLYEVSTYFSDKTDIIYGDSLGLFSRNNSTYLQAKPLTNLLNHGMPFCHQSVFVKKTLIDMYPFDLQYKYLGDYNLFRILYINHYRFTHAPIPIANYCLYEGATASNAKSLFEEKNRILGRRKDVAYYLNLL